MARGNEIIVSAQPKGVFLEGWIFGALFPGIVVQVRGSVAEQSGRFTYEAYAPGADGNRRAIMVLLPDQLQGKLATDAYVSGDRCFLYCPIMGEQLNMLVADVPGTGTGTGEGAEWTAGNVGDMMMVDSGTGMLIDSAGAPESEPFETREIQAVPSWGNNLIWVMYTGY